MLVPPFVKKFDFRGVYGKDIFDKDAFYVALSINEIFKPKKILLGWDTRVSSKNLASAFVQALQNKGIEICYLDKVSIDYVTAAAFACDFDFSIMFTGSHNTWEWTGMLIHEKGGKSLSSQNVQKIVSEYSQLSHEISFNPQQIDFSSFKNFDSETEKIYADKLQSLLPLRDIKPLKILVDLGDGSGFKALSLLERLLPSVSFQRICDNQIYGTDTPHVADPSEEKNMQHALTVMKEGEFDAGFVFDSDADRVLAIDEKCNLLNGSVLASGLIQTFSALGLTDKKVGYAVECGPSFYNTVVDLNKTEKSIIDMQAIPVGRSIVRGMVFDSKIDFGFENVGHFYVKDFFKTDSAIFILTCILFWMSMNGDLSKLIEKHPDGLRLQTSQKTFDGIDEVNKTLVTEIKDSFGNYRVNLLSVDGQRLELYKDEYLYTWAAFRKSGYEVKEKYYGGSLVKSDFDKIKQLIDQVMA